MVEGRAKSRWLRFGLTCTAFTACGRIGYVPEELPDAARDASEASPSRGPGPGTDATITDAHGTPTIDVGLDVSSGPFADTGAPPDARVVDAGPRQRDAGLDVASDARTDAAVQYPTCDAPCCCAYTCAFGVAPTGAICAGATDSAQFGFESGTQGWLLADTSNQVIPGQVSQTTTQQYAGRGSLAITLNIPAGSNVYARLESPSIPVGATLTFEVWVPPGADLESIQPYVMDANFKWTGTWLPATEFVPGCWSTIKVQVPTTAVMPLSELGVEFRTTTAAAFRGTAYVDSVSW
jgi:hypothetical protein